MVRYVSTLRSPIQANANNIKKDSLDCGISAIGCCNTPKCQKMGTTTSYLVILVLVGILQGAIEMYFIISVKQAATQHSYDESVVDWLLAASGIFQGIFAIVIAYWGDRIHRISWTAAIIIFQSLMAVTIIVPTLTHNSNESTTIAATNLNDVLCEGSISASLIEEKAHGVTTLALLFILQFGIAIGNIVFFTLGISYLDDNLKEHESPAMIGTALAAKYWGPQWGSGLSLALSKTSFGWWLGWTILGPLLFCVAVVLALFPRRLLSTVVRQAADEIIEVATNNSQASLGPDKLLADISFWPSLKRILTNKIVMFNAFSSVFVQAAIVNFYFHEENYLQSRFFFPISGNEWTSRLVTMLLKPPMIAVSVLLAGLIISKINPSPRKLAAWNVITGTICVMLFISYIFIDCENGKIAGSRKGKLNKPYCAHECLCTDLRFSPVCPENSVFTYFSPCHAGCSREESINNFRVFTNCTCGINTDIKINDGKATEGGCKSSECQMFWITFQALTVFAASILASGLIGNLLLSLRSVLPQDKSLALSIELWLVGLIVYIPGKFTYGAISEYSCQLWSPNHGKCFLHENPLFGNFINIVTASLIGVGVMFDIVVFVLVKNLKLYGKPAEDKYSPIPMVDFRPDHQDNTNHNNTEDEAADDYAAPYAVSPLISTIQATQPNYPRSISPGSNNTMPFELNDSPNMTKNSPSNLNAIIYSEIRKKNPNENIPLNFNLQTTDSEISGPNFSDLDEEPNRSSDLSDFVKKPTRDQQRSNTPETDL